MRMRPLDIDSWSANQEEFTKAMKLIALIFSIKTPIISKVTTEARNLIRNMSYFHEWYQHATGGNWLCRQSIPASAQSAGALSKGRQALQRKKSITINHRK